MITLSLTYHQLAVSLAIAVGAGLLFYSVLTMTQEYLRQRHAKQNARKIQEAEYLRAVTEDNERLKSELQAAMLRELGYIDGQAVDGKRIKFLAEELAFDGKETRVLSR
jgi:hypothetical protein